MMPEEYVVDFVREERSFFEPLHPSFFELTTAMAFKYFAEQEVDIAVVEVGLGGRLDCTNIITPPALDHHEYLRGPHAVSRPHAPRDSPREGGHHQAPRASRRRRGRGRDAPPSSRRRRTRARARSSSPRTVPRSLRPTTRPRGASMRRGPLARSWATCVATTRRATPTPSSRPSPSSSPRARSATPRASARASARSAEPRD